MSIKAASQSGLSGYTKYRSLLAATGPWTKPGMVLVKPLSIDYSGTSASIGTNGQVTFSSISSLSLNGVFSSTFDNYTIVVRVTGGVGSAANIAVRLRSNGTDDSSNNYVYQDLTASGTSVSAGRTTLNMAYLFDQYESQRAGATINVYGPALAQPTAFRSVTAEDLSSAYLRDRAATHSVSSFFDGITFVPNATGQTGALQVYGMRG